MLIKSFCHWKCHFERWIWVIVASRVNNISNQVTETETKHLSSPPQTSPKKHCWCYVKIKKSVFDISTKSLSHMHSRGSSENLIRSFSTSALCSYMQHTARQSWLHMCPMLQKLWMVWRRGGAWVEQMYYMFTGTYIDLMIRHLLDLLDLFWHQTEIVLKSLGKYYSFHPISTCIHLFACQWSRLPLAGFPAVFIHAALY